MGAYIDTKAGQFRFNDVEHLVARDEWRRQYWKAIRDGVLVAIAGWIALSVLQVAVGWIVRGFLGIPQRQDHRPDDSTQIGDVRA